MKSTVTVCQTKNIRKQGNSARQLTDQRVTPTPHPSARSTGLWEYAFDEDPSKTHSRME